MAMPIAIGTRGTVGALVRKEIEFFAQRELERPTTAKARRSQQHVNGDWRSLGGLLVATWRRKKHRGSKSLLPSLCSAVEVVEIAIPGFAYTTLRDDAEH